MTRAEQASVALKHYEGPSLQTLVMSKSIRTRSHLGTVTCRKCGHIIHDGQTIHRPSHTRNRRGKFYCDTCMNNLYVDVNLQRMRIRETREAHRLERQLNGVLPSFNRMSVQTGTVTV